MLMLMLTLRISGLSVIALAQIFDTPAVENRQSAFRWAGLRNEWNLIKCNYGLRSVPLFLHRNLVPMLKWSLKPYWNTFVHIKGTIFIWYKWRPGFKELPRLSAMQYFSLPTHWKFLFYSLKRIAHARPVSTACFKPAAVYPLFVSLCGHVTLSRCSLGVIGPF